MRNAKSPQNSDFRQIWGISGASETAARGSLVQCKEAICSPGGCCLLILPIARDPLSRLSRRGSFNCNPRMGRVKNSQRSIENPVPGWMDRRTASYRRPVLLTWAKLPRVGFSPRARGSDGPRNGRLRRPGCSETPRTLGRRSYEAGGGAAPGIPPLHLRLLLCGPAAGTGLAEGRLGQGMPPCTLSAGMWELGGGRKGGEKKKNSFPRGHKIIIK